MIGEKEELVFDDRSANLSTVAIIVVSRIGEMRSGLGTGIFGVNGVQVAVLEILICATVPFVGTADDRLVELAA